MSAALMEEEDTWVDDETTQRRRTIFESETKYCSVSKHCKYISVPCSHKRRYMTNCIFVVVFLEGEREEEIKSGERNAKEDNLRWASYASSFFCYVFFFVFLLSHTLLDHR